MFEPWGTLFTIIADVGLRTRALLHPVSWGEASLPANLRSVQLEVHQVTDAPLVVSTTDLDGRQILKDRHELKVG